MKLWIINYSAYPPGVSKWTRHYDISKYLVKKGHEVDVVGASFVRDTKKQQELDPVKIDGVCFHKIKSNNERGGYVKRILNEIKFMFSTIKYSKRLNKPSVIMGSSPGLFNGLTAYILSRIYKAKFIFEIRDIWPETWVEMGAVSKKNPIYLLFRMLEIFLYKKSDKIITLLPGMYKHLEKINIDKNKIEWISNGVDLKQFDYNMKSLKCPLELDGNKFNILYTGAIGVANGLEILLETAKKFEENLFEEVVINVVGKGSEEKRLKKLATNCSNIKFLGFCKKEEIPSLLKKSDVLLFNLKDKKLFKNYGISPNKIFEYLASERPVLFSCRAYNDMVKEGKAGISLNNLTVSELYNAILKFKSMKISERKILGKNGRKYVEENFDIPILADKLEKIL